MALGWALAPGGAGREIGSNLYSWGVSSVIEAAPRRAGTGCAGGPRPHPKAPKA